MKILILKPSSLGDVVHALPVLRILRQKWPQARISWWIYPGLEGLLAEDPDVDEVIVGKKGFLGWYRTAQSLRQRSWDLILDLQSLFRSASLGWWIRGNARTVGLELRREGAHLFHDESVPRPRLRPHAVDWYLAVAEQVTGIRQRAGDWIPVRPQAKTRVLESRREDSRPLGLLMPGARWETKRWPAERFLELVPRLCESFPTHVFAVLGGPDERPVGEQLVRSHPDRCLDLTSRTTLPELIEWIRLSDWMITNDTGPMHIAAALHRPVVGLFGPTDPMQTGPYGQERKSLVPQGLACAPCLKRRCHNEVPHACMLQHSVDTVVESLKARLGQPAVASGTDPGASQ